MAYASVHLPDGTTLRYGRASGIVQKYFVDQSAAVDLYDGTNPGPHDRVTAMDVLSLNALNAFAYTSPMTPMSDIWIRRTEIHRCVKVITRIDISALSDQDIATQIPHICNALNAIEQTRGFRTGGTRAAKLLHRLRPNIVPIWDGLVGEWYGGPKRSWFDYLQDVARDVRLPNNLHFLKRIQQELPHRLPLLRLWDILLWKLKYDGR